MPPDPFPLGECAHGTQTGGTPGADCSAATGGAGATATRDGEDPQEVVPPALRACLDHVGGVLVRGALQFLDVLAVDDALAVLRQAVPEHVGHENHVDFFADRAQRLRRFTNVFRSTN